MRNSFLEKVPHNSDLKLFVEMKVNVNDMRTRAGQNLPELSTAPVVLPSPDRKKYLDVSDLYLHLVWKLSTFPRV